MAALIAHAVAASPYYREALGRDAASGQVPLRELPTLPKATLMDNFDRIVTDPRLRWSELEAHLSGPEPDRPYLGRYKLFTTAGTTGVRGLFVEDAGEFASWIVTCLRGLAAGGWDRRRGRPGSAPPARCTSPTRPTPRCWPGGPAPPRG
jgi:phenylacetate-coenzyme A ligase PaaK-like adenylate-forming protein